MALAPSPATQQVGNGAAQLYGAGAQIGSDITTAKANLPISGIKPLNDLAGKGFTGVLNSGLLKNTGNIARLGTGIGAGVGTQMLAEKGLDKLIPTKQDGSSFSDEMKGYAKDVTSNAAGGYAAGGVYGAMIGAVGGAVNNVVQKGVRLHDTLNDITKQNEEGPKAMWKAQQGLNDMNANRNIARHNATAPAPHPLATATPMAKQSSALGTVLSGVPMIGGALSGGFDPMNGLSSMDSENKLKPYSAGGSVAAPIAYALGKSQSIKNGLKRLFEEGKAPTTAAGLKGFLLKTLLASGVGSAAGTALGRSFETRHFAGKYGSEKVADHGILSAIGGFGKNIGQSISNYGSEIVHDPYQAGKDTAGAIGTGLKWWFVDPFINSAKNFKDSAGLAGAGDMRGAAGKAIQGIGDGAFGLINAVPGAGFVGRGLGLGAKALAGGARLAGAAEAGRGIEAAGSVAERVLGAPKEWAKSTPGINHLMGYNHIFEKNPANGVVMKSLKGMGNMAPNIAATMGISPIGDHIYDTSDSGRMDQIAQSPVLNKYFGNNFSSTVQGLSPMDKLKVYQKLKGSGATTQLANLDQKAYDLQHS